MSEGGNRVRGMLLQQEEESSCMREVAFMG
jgi:hypothetical protein